MKLAYTLAMPEPWTHLYHVTLDVSGDDLGRTLRVSMPAWAPGSYLIRDFARHVQDFEAKDGRGRALPFSRADKQTWAVELGGARRVRISYRVYANELSVQTSHLDATHGFGNGTSLFVYVEGRKDTPCALTVKPYKGWRVDVALPRKGAAFLASDYDALVDAPFEIGTHRQLEFRALGKRHRIALYGHGNEDEGRLTADLKRIVEEEAAIFGGTLPYDEYLFLIHLTDKARGGLEHRHSNTSAVDRWTFQPGKKYEDFLALEAHEFFHTWNVKRIRPASLGPFDYAREVHTTLLWAMEGVTSYYDHLVLARAGLLTEERYRDFVGETITQLRNQPGRLKLPLSQSSFLAWVKLYKQDANWVNTGVSYYLKGELVAMVLDLAIRKRTKGKKSLDDVMRALHGRYPPESAGIPEPDGWRKTLEDVTNLSWRAFFKRHIDGTDEVDFEAALRTVGWRLKPVRRGEKADEKARKGEYAAAGAWMGIEADDREGKLFVKHVLADSPAQRAGIAPADQLLALDGFQLKDKDALDKRLRERADGDEMRLHLFRRGELVEARVALAAPPIEKWVVEEDKRAPSAAKALRRAWLAPRSTRPKRAPVVSKAIPGGRKGARARIEERGE